MHKSQQRVLLKIISYKAMTKIADWRQKYRWRRNKGIRELQWFTWLRNEIWRYVKYVLYLSGASVGIRLLPFLPQEMFDRIFEWWPWIGEKMLWLSNNLSKEMVLYIMLGYLAGNILMRVIYYFSGRWFEKSGFEKEEQKARRKQYDFYMQEEVVEPLQQQGKLLKRIEEELKKVGETNKEKL